MKVTLTDSEFNIKKTLIIVPRKHEILITTEDGTEVASLSMDIMTMSNGESKDVPTNSYWLIFNAATCNTMRNAADVYENNTPTK